MMSLLFIHNLGASLIVGKESACNAGDLDSIPGSGRSPGEGNGNPLQYPCLEHPMNRGTWQATVHGASRVGHDSATKPSNHQVCHSFSSKKQMSLNFMAVVTIRSDFGDKDNKICHCFHFSSSVYSEVMGPDAMILVFECFKPVFSLSSFTLINVCKGFSKLNIKKRNITHY